MNRLSLILYPPLQWLLRVTARRDYLRELHFQRKMRQIDTKEILDYSFRQAVAFANHMAEASEGYRRHLKKAGIRFPIEATPEAWRSLPILRKEDYRQNSEDWYARTENPDTIRWTYTSGSTAEPFKFPISHAAYISEIVTAELNLLDLGWHPAWQTATIKVEPPPLKGMRKIYRALMGNTPITYAALKLQPEHAPEMVERFRKAGVKYLRGYSSSLNLLAEAMLERNLHYEIPLITSFGESMTPTWARTIEKAFGGKIYCDYSSSETMNMGFQCREQSGYHLNYSRFFIEVVDGDRPVKPGESGEIVVTYFKNLAMPLVRYALGDAGTLADPFDKCPCGNSNPQFSEIIGRVSETIRCPSGKTVDVLYFVWLFEWACEHMLWFKSSRSRRTCSASCGCLDMTVPKNICLNLRRRFTSKPASQCGFSGKRFTIFLPIPRVNERFSCR